MKPIGAGKADKKESRARKNPKMAEIHAAQRKANNAKRPKQHWEPLLQGWVR